MNNLLLVLTREDNPRVILYQGKTVEEILEERTRGSEVGKLLHEHKGTIFSFQPGIPQLISWKGGLNLREVGSTETNRTPAQRHLDLAEYYSSLEGLEDQYHQLAEWTNHLLGRLREVKQKLEVHRNSPTSQ